MYDISTIEGFANTVSSENFLTEDKFFKNQRLDTILYWFWINYEDVHKYDKVSGKWFSRAEVDVAKGEDYGWDEDLYETCIKQTVRKLMYESLGSVLDSSKVSDYDLFKELGKIAQWMRGAHYTDHVIELIKLNFYSGGKVPEHPDDYEIHLLDSDVESELLSNLDLAPPRPCVRIE